MLEGQSGMGNFQRVFGAGKPVIAMVHLGALPGAPLYDADGATPLYSVSSYC